MNNRTDMKVWVTAVALTIAASILFSFGIRFVSNDHNNSASSLNTVQQPGGNRSLRKVEPALFIVDDIVEVYEPKIHPSYAFSAQIARVGTNVNSKRGTVQYDVRLVIDGNVIYSNINSSAIMPMTPFGRNSRAMCDEGRTLNSKLVPCTVVDFREASKSSSSFPAQLQKFFSKGSRQQYHPWLYSVSYQGEEDGELREVPVSRIRRIMVQEEEVPQAENEARSVQPSNTNEEKNVSSTFPTGTVIEIYEPVGGGAFPARVIGMNVDVEKNMETKYHLIHGITAIHMKDVDAKFVHAYQVYPDGTMGECNVGKIGKEARMVPCKVMNHIIDANEDEEIIYRVLANFGDEMEHLLTLSQLRVQRIHGIADGLR